MSLPCRFNPLTGKLEDFCGQTVADCSDCAAGCETKSFVSDSGIIGDDLNFRVTNIGCEFRLEWDCPGCGSTVTEECDPLDAIPLSEEVREDPLCFSCRKKSKGAEVGS